MNKIYDVIVVGGGIIGLSAAIAMSKRNFRVAVIDASSLTTDTSKIDPRVYAINKKSEILLEKLNVMDLIDKTRLSPYQHMHVWDAASNAYIDFDARMVGSTHLGTIIEESVIKAALLLQMSKHDIACFPNSSVAKVEILDDHIHLTDINKKTYDAKLMIVSDGASSSTRQLLGVQLNSWSYHQKAIVTIIRTKLPHNQTAYQVFNEDGPLAFLPLADPNLCSIVWSTTPNKVDYLMKLSNEKFNLELKEAFAVKLGDCEVVDRLHQFPLQMRHAKSYSGNRWLLMGDAAHTIHPLAGLGLNVGLNDLDTWLNLVDKDKTKIFSNKTLSAYQRLRKVDVWKMIALMDGLKAIFANPIPPFKFLRGLGLSAANNFLPLKRWFIEQAGN